MARAYRSRSVGQQTPPRSPIAGDIRAALRVPDVDHAVLRMLLAVRRRFRASNIERRAYQAGGM